MIDEGDHELDEHTDQTQDASTSAKVLYRPVGIASSIIAGIAAGQLFKLIWKHAAPGPDSEAPDALNSEHRMRDVLLAAAAQGAIYAVVKAATQRGGARWFQRRTGEWPGK